jgi:hypothetical protein
LNEYFLAFTQEIGDGGLMSLASRLIAMTTLVALITRTLVTLIAWALLALAAGLRRGRGRRRGNYFFLRLDKLYLALVVMTVCTIICLVHLSTGRARRLFACPSSSSSASTSRKLTARLIF